MTVYDYSFARPDPASLGEGVMRYACSGHQNGKRLEAVELRTLWDAGLKVGHVFENTVDPVSWDGPEGWRQHLELGFPEHVPLYFAADSYVPDWKYESIGQLLDATGVPLASRGIYGGARLVQWCIDNGHATWGWITNALSWSGASSYDEAASLAPSAHLQQFYNASDVDGTDANRALQADWGGWHPSMANSIPTPPVTISPSPEEDNDMTLVQAIADIKYAFDLFGNTDKAGQQEAVKQLVQAPDAAARDHVVAAFVSQLAGI